MNKTAGMGREVARRLIAGRRFGAQAGSALIEGLLAAFIFASAAMGAMALIVTSSQSAGDTRMRMDAAAMAEDIVGRMQADMGGSAALLGNYDDAVIDPAVVPSNKTQWKANVAGSLPSSSANIAVSTAYAGGLGADVTVRISWTPAGQTQRVYTLTTAMAPNQ